MPENILSLLRAAKGVVSGERISAELGITRAAVWKKIRMLREKGFVITAVPSRGYLLVSAPDFSVEELLSLVNRHFWKKILFYESVGSTNEEAAGYAARGDGGGPFVIIADAQEKGRGRLGRKWISPPGANIYMSILLRPAIPPRDVTLLTVLAAVSAARALRRGSGVDVSIKWPNDLVVAGRKTGGILTEVRSDPDSITQAVIGIGINANMECGALPDELRPIATSLLGETGKRCSRTFLVAAILDEVEELYPLLRGEGRRLLIAEWKRLSSTIGKRVSVVVADERLEGLAEDIDGQGGLLLRLASGEVRRVSAGDLTMLR